MDLEIGIDIVNISRVRGLIKKYGNKFIDRIFLEKEVEYCINKKNSAVHFAGKLAAKEAVYKAFKIKWNTPLHWKDIAILNDTDGIPQVFLRGNLNKELENGRVKISISHNNEYAVASALLIKGD